jgi:hypothetical protein
VDADAGNRQWPRPEVGVGGHVTGTLAGWVGVCVSAKQAGMKFFMFLYNIYNNDNLQFNIHCMYNNDNIYYILYNSYIIYIFDTTVGAAEEEELERPIRMQALWYCIEC